MKVSKPRGNLKSPELGSLSVFEVLTVEMRDAV
jgi:hypothetical protein